MRAMNSPALRRAAQLVGTGAAAALVATGLGAGTAAAAIDTGALDCAPLSLAGARVPAPGVPDGSLPKDRPSDSPTAAETTAMEAEFAKRLAALGFDPLKEAIRDPIEIDVVWHVIREGPTWQEGNIPRTQIRAQVKVLNHAYRGHGEAAPGARSPFKFRLADVTRTTNANWFNNAHEPDVEREMKEATREGTAETLNSWSTNLLSVGLLGYATFPSDYQGDPLLDGVVNTFQSLPGGDPDNTVPAYDEGDTATHEVGHWVGLFHTFGNTQDGCDAPGDHVDDTPYEQDPYFGDCSDGPRDTCPQPGNDPIENFMDYTDDVCMDRFSIGQRERAIEQWYSFRDGVTQ